MRSTTVAGLLLASVAALGCTQDTPGSAVEALPPTAALPCDDARQRLIAAKQARLVGDSVERRSDVDQAAREARSAGCNVDDLIARSVGVDEAGLGSGTESTAACEAFSTAMAEELISNSDTGERKIEGAILATTAVAVDADTWIVAINVGDSIVLLRHDGADAADEFGGSWGSVDSTSEQATSFPVEHLTDDEQSVARRARSCLEA